MKLTAFVNGNGFIGASKAAIVSGIGARVRNKGKGLSMVFVPPGTVLGVPLTIIQDVFTNLHYGYNIITLKMVGLQCLIGYYTYGKDRYKDALEYRDAPYPTEKAGMYQTLVENAGVYANSYDAVFVMIVSIILFDLRD